MNTIPDSNKIGKNETGNNTMMWDVGKTRHAA